MNKTSTDSQSRNPLETEAEKTIEQLMVVVAKEREYAVKLDGESLQNTTKTKAKLMMTLEEQLKSLKKHPGRIKRSLSLLQFMNSANLRLFQSILKLSCQYRKILNENQLESAAYSREGQFDRLPVSLKFVGSA